ncbi:hypothetical protein [Wolbachia endosymbiont of Mansonella ozzardi]|uniref:hypothetical protein n=1 Tax=Wolbachia endosymbiont of Mansonella ozzardi TaxID=137464 RepID=UPI001CE1AED5
MGQSNLTNLTSLEISNNHIEDKGFTFLICSKGLKKLTSLDVENNNIFGGEMLRYKRDIALKDFTSLYVGRNSKRFLDDKKLSLIV